MLSTIHPSDAGFIALEQSMGLGDGLGVALHEIFRDSNKIHSVLNSMIELGLGYLKLGLMSMNLIKNPFQIL